VILLAKDQIISFEGSKTLMRILAGFTAVAIVMMCFVLSQDASAGQSDAPLQIPVKDLPEKELVQSLSKDESNMIDDEKNIDGPWQVVRMRVTAYCPCSKCCGEYSDGITACNHQIRPGDVFVAADDTYKFGTEMVIPEYNSSQPVKVLDRGGAIKGDRIDAFFHTHQEALEWGVQYLDVRVKIR
jgi:3D (Asp-Asp-Asp) domain-containing protein